MNFLLYFRRWRCDRARLYSSFMKMSRRPRLPTIITYIFIILIFVIVYKLVFNSSNNSINNNDDKNNEDNKQDNSLNEKSLRNDKAKISPERRRKVIRPINPHDFHLMINNMRICADADIVSPN